MRNFIKNSNEGISFWGAIGALLLYYFILPSIVVGIVFGIIEGIAHIQPNTIIAAWVDQIASVFTYIIAILLMFKFLNKKGLKGLSIKGNINANCFVFILFFFSGYVLFRGNSIDLITRQIPIPKFIEEAFSNMVVNNYIMFFGAAIIAPIFEEIVCRGIILQLFLKRYNDIVSVIFSAIIFGLIHMNVPQFINAFIIGIVLGYVYLKTKSLIACIIGHFINNIIACILMIVKPNAFEKFNLVQLSIGALLIALSIIVARKNLKESNVNEVQLNA